MNFATYAAGAWSAIELLEDRAEPLGTTGFDLVHDGTDYTAAWIQQDPTDTTVMRTYSRRTF